MLIRRTIRTTQSLEQWQDTWESFAQNGQEQTLIAVAHNYAYHTDYRVRSTCAELDLTPDRYRHFIFVHSTEYKVLVPG